MVEAVSSTTGDGIGVFVGINSFTRVGSSVGLGEEGNASPGRHELNITRITRNRIVDRDFIIYFQA
jgi:hypothetical protein